MSAKRASPTKTTRERIEQDKKKFDRLVKKVERVVSTHSPDYVNYLDTQAVASSRLINQANNEVILGTSLLDTWADHALIDALWDSGQITDNQARAAGVAVDLGQRDIWDWMQDRGWEVAVDETSIVDKVISGLAGLFDKGFDLLPEAIQRIITSFITLVQNVIDTLNKIVIEMGDTFLALLDSVQMIPLLIGNIGKLIDSFVNIDEDTLIDNAISFAKVQVRIKERFESEGLIEKFREAAEAL